jgi:hypothetical protein
MRLSKHRQSLRTLVPLGEAVNIQSDDIPVHQKPKWKAARSGSLPTDMHAVLRSLKGFNVQMRDLLLLPQP